MPFTASAGNVNAILQHWLNTCNELSKARRFDELQFALQDIFNGLAHLDKNGLWDEIPLSDTEACSNAIHHFCLLTAQVQFNLNKPCLTSQQILHLLRSMKICQRLAVRNNENTTFGRYCLELDAIKDILKDPWLDLGSDGPEIRRVIQDIERPGAVQLSLTNPAIYARLPEGDKAFFDEYLQKHASQFSRLGLNGRKSLIEDFGSASGKLSPQVVHLRRMKIITMALMAKYRTLGSPGLYITIKDTIETFLNSFSKKETDLEAAYVQRKLDQIDKLLRKSTPPSEFVANKFFLMDKSTVHIGPYGLDHIDYDKPLVDEKVISSFASRRFPSQYKKAGQDVPEAMAHTIIEGCVSNCEPVAGEPVNEDGKPLTPGPANDWTSRDKTHYLPPGESHTERYILSDNKAEMGLRRDVWAELRVMQTAPLKTRIPNTLEIFTRYSGLLGNSKYALAWQRAFSNNLFRDNALADFLKERPEYAVTLVRHLRQLSTMMTVSRNIQGMLFITLVSQQAYNVLKKQMPGSPAIEQFDQLVKEHETLIAQWTATCAKKKNLKAHQRAIHQTHLLLHAEALKEHLNDLSFDPLSAPKWCSNLMSILKSYYLVKQIPQPLHEKNYFQDESIAYMMHRIFPACNAKLQDEAVRTKFIDALMAEQNISTIGGPWTQVNNMFYQKGNLSVELTSGLLYNEGIAKRSLSDSIARDSVCRSLFDGDAIHTISCSYWIINSKDKPGGIYEFKYKDKRYQIIELEGEERLIYKLTAIPGKTPTWHLWYKTSAKPEKTISSIGAAIRTVLDESSDEKDNEATLPEDILNNHCWASTSSLDFIIEDSSGTFLYEGRFNRPEAGAKSKNSAPVSMTVNYIIKSEKDRIACVVNPWENNEFDRFLALARPNQILATGDKSGKVDRIKYLKHKLEYQWDNSKGCWSCTTMPGYRLSNKKLETLLAKKEDSLGSKPFFFDPNFSYYHVLEHPTRHSKLFLPVNEYQKALSAENSENISKHNLVSAVPVHGGNEESRKNYLYDIDGFGTLKTSSPEGYLYLAYILYTQGKYEQAVFYLKKAQSIKPDHSKECRQILEWMNKWKADSPEAQIFMMHVHLLVLEQSSSIERSPKLDKYQKELLLKLVQCNIVYKSLDQNNKIPPCLKLNNLHKHISGYGHLISAHLEEFVTLGEEGIVDDFHSIGLRRQDFKGMLSSWALSLDKEKKQINEEINQLKTLIKPKESQSTTDSNNLTESHLASMTIDRPLLPVFPDMQKYLHSDPVREVPYALQERIDALGNRFKEKKSFSDELGTDLMLTSG